MAAQLLWARIRFHPPSEAPECDYTGDPDNSDASTNTYSDDCSSGEMGSMRIVVAGGYCGSCRRGCRSCCW